jgi:hypothetical protein
MSITDRIDRRQFASRLALGSGAIAALAHRESICADVDPVSARTDDDAKPKQEEKSVETDKHADEPLELLLLTYLMRRYPSEHFNDESMRGIFGDIRGDVSRGRVLSKFPLKNSDEPAFVFQAYRKPE